MCWLRTQKSNKDKQKEQRCTILKCQRLNVQLVNVRDKQYISAIKQLQLNLNNL